MILENPWVIQLEAKIIFIIKIKPCDNKKSKPTSRDPINRGLIVKGEARSKTENSEFI